MLVFVHKQLTTSIQTFALASHKIPNKFYKTFVSISGQVYALSFFLSFSFSFQKLILVALKPKEKNKEHTKTFLEWLILPCPKSLWVVLIPQVILFYIKKQLTKLEKLVKFTLENPKIRNFSLEKQQFLFEKRTLVVVVANLIKGT